MAAKKFETALIITGDGSGGTRAIKLTREQLEKLSKEGKNSSRSLKQANNQLGVMRGRLKKLSPLIGAFSVAGIGYGITRMFSGAITEAEKLERNLLRTEQLIISTGGVAGKTSEQLHEDARQLAFATLQSTEGIMAAQQIMLTFKSITGDTFTRATELAADLATVTGVDLKSSVTQLGKALEDPVKGINAMTRSGVSFTEQQKEMIKSLAEAGDKAGAQKLILDELASQYGGVARNEAKGFAGVQDTLKQTFQELKQAIGATIIEGGGLAGLYSSVSGVLGFLTKNLESVITAAKVLTVVMVARMAPAVVGMVGGLVSYIATVGSAAGATSLLSSAMAFVGGPIGLVVVALAGLAFWYSSSQKETERLKNSVLLSNGTHETHANILNRVNAISSEYTAATKDRRAEIKGEVQDLILNSQAELENARAKLGSLKAKQYAFRHDPDNRNNPVFRNAGDIDKVFGRALTSQLEIVTRNEVAIGKIQKRYDLLGKTIKPTATTVYGLNGALTATGKVGKGAAEGLSDIEKKAQSLTDTYLKYSDALVKERAGVEGSTIAQYEQELQLVRVGKEKQKLSAIDIKNLVNYKKETLAIIKQTAVQKLQDKVREDALKLLTDARIKTAQLTAKLTGQAVAIAGLTKVESEELRVSDRRNEVLDEAIRKQEEYRESIKTNAEQIAANNILIELGTEAYKKHVFQVRYGVDANWELASSQQATIDMQQMQIEGWNNVGDSLYDAITKGVDLMPSLQRGIRGVTDSLLEAVAGTGSFSDVIGKVGGLYSSGGGFKGAVSNYQTGSQLTSLFTDSQSSQIGGGIGAALGSFIPGGAFVGNILGSLIGGLFDSTPQEIKAQFGSTSAGGRAVYGTSRNNTGQSFSRDTALGTYGITAANSQSLGRDSEEQIAGVMALLDSVESLDNVIGSFASDTDIQRIKNNLADFTGNALKPAELLEERLTIVIDSMSVGMASLFDTSKTAEEMATRIQEVGYINNTVIPSFDELGLKLSDAQHIAVQTVDAYALVNGGMAGMIDGLRAFQSVQNSYATDIESLKIRLLGDNESRYNYLKDQTDGLVAQLQGATDITSINSLSEQIRQLTNQGLGYLSEDQIQGGLGQEQLTFFEDIKLLTQDRLQSGVDNEANIVIANAADLQLKAANQQESNNKKLEASILKFSEAADRLNSASIQMERAANTPVQVDVDVSGFDSEVNSG